MSGARIRSVTIGPGALRNEAAAKAYAAGAVQRLARECQTQAAGPPPAGSARGDGMDWLSMAIAARFHAAELAASLGVSLRQLERVFLNSTGWHPQEWLHHARFWHACALLDAGRRPNEFAPDLGFSAPTSFFHAFKAYHACTTRHYLAAGLSGGTPGLEHLRRNKRVARLLRRSNNPPSPETVLSALAAPLVSSGALRICRAHSLYNRNLGL
jgi:AraC-like DNA-binding protein